MQWLSSTPEDSLDQQVSPQPELLCSLASFLLTFYIWNRFKLPDIVQHRPPFYITLTRSPIEIGYPSRTSVVQLLGPVPFCFLAEPFVCVYYLFQEVVNTFKGTFTLVTLLPTLKPPIGSDTQ